jgi:predicted alpha-1,2-mannosidase
VFRLTPSNESKTYTSFQKHFLKLDHKQETAIPGYYKIQFAEPKITAELTATTHGGAHRYQFAPQVAPRLILEPTSHLSSAGWTENVKVIVDAEKNMVIGEILLLDGVSGRYKGLPVYFVLTFDQKFLRVRAFGAKGEVQGHTPTAKQTIYKANKERLFLEFEFALATEIVDAKLALSHVDQRGAQSNFDAELGKLSFDDLQEKARSEWNKTLGRIQVRGGSGVDQTKFYTALYRSFLMPSEFSDAPTPSGVHRYLGYDKKIHESASPYYANFSLWDTFRTTHPLYNLIAQAEQRDMIRSLLNVADQSERLPRWGGGAGHADSMLGFPAHIAIAESYLKGVDGFDAEKALNIMKRTALPEKTLEKGQECLESYEAFGFCPLDKHDESVSFTLEYAYADYSTSLFAEALGRQKDSEKFRSRAWKALSSLWDTSLALFVPHDSKGERHEVINAKDSSYLALDAGAKAFVEGSANQWRWYVPYRPEVLIKLYGDRFVPQLEEFFAESRAEIGSMYPGTNYWHGNEPSIHAAYLFAFAGRPDLTQKWVRWIMETKYQAAPKGLDGDDDAGTISSWFVLSSLGFYPLAGTTKYAVGYPLFQEAELQLALKKLVIKKINQGPDEHYVKEVWINGQRLQKPWFDHHQIAGGGEIVFVMSANPQAWGQ